MEDDLEQDDDERNALNRAVLDRMMEMQRAAQVDCASQCEDPAKEAELLSLKRKLRVKKRKLITAQSMADVAESGSNRPVLPAHSLQAHLSHTSPYKLNRYLPHLNHFSAFHSILQHVDYHNQKYLTLDKSFSVVFLHNSILLKNSTPLKVTKLEVINYTDSGKGHNVSSLFDSPTECRSTGSFLDGPTPIYTKLALLKPTEKGMRTDNEGLIMLKSVVEGNRSGLGVWCQATVIRVNAARSVQGVVSSSTYDIQYDDGKVEKGVDIGFLRARDPLTSTSTMTDTNCSVQEVIPTTPYTGIPSTDTPSKYAQDKAGKCVGADGNDKSEGERFNMENADESNAPPCTAATVSATATAENILDDYAAKDGLNRLPVPSNCPSPSVVSSSALATGATPKTTSTARAVSYSHSSSRRVATRNGDSNRGTGSVVQASDQQASTRQSEANKLNRQSYPSLKEPQYNSDREFTIASFKAPAKGSDRASDVSREVVKRPQRGREQLKDFFRDSTKDPVKEPVKSPSSEIIKEPLLEQTQGQEAIMRAADTDTDVTHGKRIEASEGQSNSNYIKTTEQAMKGQQQLSSSMLQSPPTSQSTVGMTGGYPIAKPMPRDGAEVLRANATNTGEIGVIGGVVELRDQIPIIKQEGKSVAIPLNIIKNSTTGVAVDADEMEVGSYVEGNYADIGEWFTGRISKKWKDGSYDIQYDDGDREVGVRPPLLRLLSRAP